jgi:long-chain acyl-CoA synthetase
VTNLDYLPWRRPARYDALPSVRDDRYDLTYAEFGSWVDAAAEQLAEYGVRPGSVVAVMLPNRVELLVAMVAAWRLGAAATPVNPAFTATEADYQIGDADAAVVVNSGPDAPNGGRPAIAVDTLRRTRRGGGGGGGAGPRPPPPPPPPPPRSGLCGQPARHGRG